MIQCRQEIINWHLIYKEGISSYHSRVGVFMNIYDLVKQWIPGLTLLSRDEVNVFFQTKEGKNLKPMLDALFNQLHHTENNQLYSFSDNFAMRHIHRIPQKIQTDQCIKKMQNQLMQDMHFIPLKKMILKAMLKKWLLEYYFINSVDHATLIEKDYTAAFYHAYFVQELSLDQCIQNWRDSFESDTTDAPMRIKNLIATNRAAVIEDTRKKIGFLLDTGAYAENEMNDLLFSIATRLYFSDTSAASKVALLKKAFNYYLVRHDIHFGDYFLSELSASFSRYVLSILKPMGLKKTKEQVDRIANVHLLFGILGLREPAGPILEGFDVYNYVSLSEGVSKFETVLLAMLKPVKSFFNEYVQISRIEKDRLTCILRAIIPILIMTCFVAFFFSLLVPFAMHAIIEIMMLIPILYVSMVLASSYVDLKNWLVEKAIIYFYGSRYEHPDYTVNERLLMGFENNQMIAEAVRRYYVACFVQCDEIISDLATKFKRGVLSQDESDFYERMIQREVLLKAEWFDIHDNHYFVVDKIKSLFSQRLNQDTADARKNIVHEGNAYIESLVEAIQHHLQRSENIENAQDPMTRQCYQPHMRWSLFKPTGSIKHLAQRCISQQATMRLIDESRPFVDTPHIPHPFL